MMARGGGGGGIVIIAVALVFMIGGYVVYTSVIPAFTHHPTSLPTVSQLFTMATDAYGHATVHLRHVFNVTPTNTQARSNSDGPYQRDLLH